MWILMSNSGEIYALLGEWILKCQGYRNHLINIKIKSSYKPRLGITGFWLEKKLTGYKLKVQ